MTIGEILLLAIALATDAFAVSICKGRATRKSYLKTGVVCGAWFGIFQALMPFLGWLLGKTVSSYVERFAPYIAFVLLSFLGAKMLIEVIKEGKECPCEKDGSQEKDASLSFRVMLAFAIATSIDALAAGLTFAALNAPILLSILSIGIVTFIACFIGAAVGAKLGSKWKDKAQIAGGTILILIGLKVLIEHLISVL